MAKRSSKGLIMGGILLLVSACSFISKPEPLVSITPEPTWTPIPQVTSAPLRIEAEPNNYPFDDSVLIFFQPSTDQPWQAFDLTGARAYDLSDLPTSPLSASPIVNRDGEAFLQFERDLFRISPAGGIQKAQLPEDIMEGVRCDFPRERGIYCFAPDLSQAFLINDELSIEPITLDPFLQAVEGSFYPPNQTTNNKVRALYPKTLHLVLDEGIYLRDFNFETGQVEEHLLKMNFDQLQDEVVRERAATDPDLYISTMEPLSVLALPDNMSRAYVNTIEESMFGDGGTFKQTNYINLSSGPLMWIELQLPDGLPNGAFVYRDRLVIPRDENDGSPINFSFPEAYDLKDMRTTLMLADWLPFDEPVMEIHPYREGWMLLTSTQLNYMDNEGIILRRFELPQEVSELLLNESPHFLSQPLEP